LPDHHPPKFKERKFNCPHCQAFAQQDFELLHTINHLNQAGSTPVWLAECYSCKKITIWHDRELVYPISSNAPPPNPDMPEDVLKDFNEARLLLPLSPRACCALLRLCVEKIANILIPSNASLNDKIKQLVANGLDESIQQALDSIRVIGAESIHHLQMDLRDDQDTASALFGIVNLIVESTISRAKKVKSIYDKLPASAKEAIQKRDGKTLPS